MLMEADLPDDVDALRALVLEQARALADLSDVSRDNQDEKARQSR
ncbi:hypothetical protein Ga0102493_111372 [Erythrobacter litoralis]|nr:hypothetical protein [Erythrobacter litoralis]AOL22400.1 hypothetical protein Ga0102493_111372 [Erythrobacter litoralis]